jgi:RNA polymerase sigma-70 factor (ECF subfamily)
LKWISGGGEGMMKNERKDKVNKGIESKNEYVKDKDSRKHRLNQKNNEQTILKLLRKGDSDGMKLIMQKYPGQLFSVADRICNNHADTKEVLQDVYWTALSKIDHFEERSTLATWLFRIAVNASLMKLRSRKMNKNTFSMETMTAYLNEEQNALCPVEAEKSPDDRLMTKEFYEHVWDSVQKLPEIYQDVFWLRDIQGFSIKETSILLKTSPAAIKSRLHRSRFSIRKDLKKYLYEA